MSQLGTNLKNARKKNKLTQRQLADMIGAKHNSISNWENGINKPDPDTIGLLCGVLGISASDLIGDTTVPTHPDILSVSRRRVPLLGEIACGEPIYADEDYSTMMAVGADVDCDFALRCKGDSMTGARIYDGDIVFIKRQDFVDEGAIAAVLIDDDATLKRVYHLADGRLELRAENPKYRPIVVGGEDDTRIYKILGKAMAFQSVII
ncbi:MAG: XRE family transcriptional regulator [Clostridiales bacterium]|nr:XRE family transcriptional regulator [Clostridiales bacterium]MDY5514836.1 XRE family transcriptional regulator [Candidatus Ventricola sp.]